METFEQQTFPSLEAELQCCQPVYRANQLPSPGSEKARQMTVGSGRQCSMLLDQSSPLGAFSKILLESQCFTNSMEYCYVWQVWDTRSDFSAFQLTPLAQSTEDNGCSLWRTPNASEAKAENHPAGFAMDLTDQVRNAKLWPTPRHEGFDAGCHNGKPDSLDAAAKLWPILPTPRANHSGLESHGQISIGGSLNPCFVEELMGFPIDHTALKRSGTPSCRSKRSRSSQQSRTLSFGLAIGLQNKAEPNR